MRLKAFYKLKTKISLIAFFVLSTFLIAPSVFAWDGDVLGEIVGWLIGLIINALGLVLLLVIKGLILIASYQYFIDAQAVVEGWAIVRDLSNMFFVVILLVIAFATILHIEEYNYKKWLPKLILMAILINFSKTICGLMIDVAQIVMLTFVNAFKDIAGGNIIDMLGIKDIVTMAKNTDDVGFTTIVGAYVLGLIYMIIALVVITTMMMMLVMRLVMIWIYVVLSPLAYLLAAFPGGAQYSSKWWKDFTQNLIVGPVLAFFIWLSFAALQTGTELNIVTTAAENNITEEAGSFGVETANADDAPFAANQASTPSSLIKFVIGIGMLIGGLKIAQEIGGAAGGIAGKGMSKLSTMGAATAGFVGGATARFGGNVGMGIAKKVKLKEGLGSIASQTGVTGKILAATGIRSLATSSLSGLNSQQKKIEEKAVAKLTNLDDTRVMARYANQSSFTGMGVAMKKKARKKMPSAIHDDVAMNTALSDMSREDLSKLSDAEWQALGARNAELGGRSKGFIQKDSDARGAFNYGKRENGHGNFISGTNRNGEDLTSDDRFGSYMDPRNEPLSADVINTLIRDDSHRFDYFKDAPALKPDSITEVPLSEQNQERGRGNLSVNKFAAGQSTLAVDFDKLNLEDINKGAAGDKDWRNVRGVNTSDQGMIKKIASNMAGLIDQEISALKAKSQLSGGEEKRLSSLNNTRNRLSNPENLSNLSVLNSSASRFKMSDVKETMVHEEIHGLGYENEDEVRAATGVIMSTRDYGARKDKASVEKILVDNSLKTRSVDEIVANEKKSESPVYFSDESKGMDTSGLENKISDFVDKIEEVSDGLKNMRGLNSLAGKSNDHLVNFPYLFKNLQATLSKNNKEKKGLSADFGVDKVETPLEISVIAKTISDTMDENNNKSKS